MECVRMNVLTILTATIAVYGAVLSTLNYRHGRAEKNRILRVKFTGGFLTFGPGQGNSLSKFQYIIEVINPGHLPVVVRSVTIAVKKLSILVPSENSESRRLPYELQPGQSCNFWIDAKEVAEGLVAKKISGEVGARGVVTDAIGSIFKSKTNRISVDEFIKD